MHLQPGVSNDESFESSAQDQSVPAITSDILLNPVIEENSGFIVNEHVVQLEAKVQQQTVEIADLKHSVSNILNRLQILELSKKNKKCEPENDTELVSYKDSTLLRSKLTAGRTQVLSKHKPDGNVRNDCLRMKINSIDNNLSLKSSRRWLSTSDFYSSNKFSEVYGSNNSLASYSSQSGIKSIQKNQKSISNGTIKSFSKGGIKDINLKVKDGIIRCSLRGHFLTFYLPSSVRESYSLSHVISYPEYHLQLNWIYGYRGRDSRNNLFLLPTGELLYYVANVIILHHIANNVQRHYMEHTSDVKCISLHPNKLLIASGQGIREGKQAHVRIWDSASLHTLYTFGMGYFCRGIACLAFSQADGGNFLTAIDESTEHHLSIWSWKENKCINDIKGATDTILAMDWHPFEKHSFVSCGKGHITFWTFENGLLHRRLGVMDPRDKPRYITCLGFTENGDILSGDSNGNIMTWSRGGNSVASIIRQAHQGSVFAVFMWIEGVILSGGGKDGRIIVWNRIGRKTGLETKIPELYGGVRTLVPAKSSQLVIGTTRNCILLADEDLKLSHLINGHSGELWAVACHPKEPFIISGAYDSLLKMCNAVTHQLVWIQEWEDSIQAVSFSPDGILVAVCGVSGRWALLNITELKILSLHANGSEPIQICEFSPDGTYLALGSQDGKIYLYQIENNGNVVLRLGICQGHTSSVRSLDWSNDSVFLRSTSLNYELLYWHVNGCHTVSQCSQMRDVEWASQTSPLSLDTIGIWPEEMDNTDILSCCCNKQRNLLATADDHGVIRLYSFPANQPTATKVGFLHNDMYLISTGCRDGSIFQWQVLKVPSEKSTVIEFDHL